MFTAIHRGNSRAFKSTLRGALSILLLASSPLSAEASSDPATLDVKTEAMAFKPGVVMMAPIPDRAAPEPSISTDDGLQSEANCLATAIYFEARGESAKGQKAVAEVIVTRSRTRGHPKTICGVVYEGSQRSTGCQFSFTCDRASDTVRDGAAWSRVQRIAQTVLRTRGKVKPVARGATNYHASYVTPRWASRMVKVAQIGTHIFYRP